MRVPGRPGKTNSLWPRSGKALQEIVRPPRVAESPIHYECKTWRVIQVPGNSRVGCSNIIIGRVVAVHIKGDVITRDGLMC
jgi:flavin reductase (DIM6/NTAB) family NADH-FMN oxidoreductase RutF